MKILILIALSTITLAKASNDDPIHVVCSPSEEGLVVFVPHPYECQKFFMCQGMTGILMQCPAGLQFDINLNVCNYPNIVGCVNTPYPTTSTTEMVTTTSDEEPNTTIFPDDYQDYHL